MILKAKNKYKFKVAHSNLLGFSMNWKNLIKINSLALILIFISACQTSDFGFKTSDDSKDSGIKNELPTSELPDETLDQKKVNSNKLFNTSKDKENIRPKIGLILGPGLSYSLAHLGALKALNDQKIPIHAVSGMGWASLIAANYALNGAVNDMRWKAFQGSFANVVSTGFLNGAIKETSDSVYESLISQYTRGKTLNQSKIPFLCPALQVSKGRAMIYKSGSYAQALDACLKVPPLAQTETSAWAYIVETKELIRMLKDMGAQKIVFINVIPANGMNWGKSAENIEARDKLFWAQVINGLNPKTLGVDHVFNLPTDGHAALDFKNVKKIIEDSEQKSQDYFARFARTYSF